MRDQPPCPIAVGAAVVVPEWARPLCIGIVKRIELRPAPAPTRAPLDGAWTWFLTISFGKGRGNGVFEMRHVKVVDPVSALARIR